MTVTLLKKEADVERESVLHSLEVTLLRLRHCPYIMTVTLLKKEAEAEGESVHPSWKVTLLRQ